MYMKTKTEIVLLNDAENFIKKEIIFESAYDQLQAQYESFYILFLFDTTYTIQ